MIEGIQHPLRSGEAYQPQASVLCPCLAHFSPSASPSLTCQELEAKQALGLQLPAGREQLFVAVFRAGLAMRSLLLSAPRIPFAEVSDTRSSLHRTSKLHRW